MHLKTGSVLATGIILAGLNLAIGGRGQKGAAAAAPETRPSGFWGEADVRDPRDPKERERLLARGKEMGLLRRLGDAAAAWVSKGEQSSRKEVDAVIEEILAQPACSVPAYFAAAKIADLCGDGSKAIAILEDVVAGHGSDDAPGWQEPVNVVAYHWIGRIARQSREYGKATSAYEKILENSKDLASKKVHAARSMMYLAEIASLEVKDQSLAVKRLDKAIEIIDSTDRHKGTAELEDMYRDWLVYQRSAAKIGKMAARQGLLGDPKKTGMAPMIVGNELSLNGIVSEASPHLYDGNRNTSEILTRASTRRAIEDDASPADSGMARLLAGFMNERRGNYAEAEKDFLGLFERESYFSPIAGICAGRCKKAGGEDEQADGVLEQVRVKYPGYDVTVKEIKESWKTNPPKKSE